MTEEYLQMDTGITREKYKKRYIFKSNFKRKSKNILTLTFLYSKFSEYKMNIPGKFSFS